MKAPSRQYQNQRLFRPRQRKQQHLLEVSIRRDRERAIRLRACSILLFKIIVFVGLGGGLWFGGREGFRRYVWQNPYFFLTDVRVHTDGTLTREQILLAAGVSEKMNFFQLNLAKVRTAIEHLPQVEHVELNRGLPNKFSIEVSERQPIAWLTDRPEIDPTAADGSYLVDSRGYVMTCRKRRQDFIHLPMISGVVLEDFAPGQKANTLEIQAALELIRLNVDSTRWQIYRVDVSRGYCLLVTDRAHARITFGLDDIDRQLTRLYRLLDYLEPSHREIQTVNLLVERNIPVTFMDDPEELAPAAPPPDTTPVKAADKGAKSRSESKTADAAVAKSTPAKASGSKSSATDKPGTTVRRAEPVSKEVNSKRGGDGVKKPFRPHG